MGDETCNPVEDFETYAGKLKNAIHCMGEQVLPVGSYEEDVEICEKVVVEVRRLKNEISRANSDSILTGEYVRALRQELALATGAVRDLSPTKALARGG